MDNFIDSISRFERFGSKLGLDRMKGLLARLGDPQKRLKVIHVAGTNGKGSVCAFISSVLVENGYNTALYLSPFVEDFRERIQLNGEFIEDAELNKHTEEVVSAADAMVEEGSESPTEFEIITAVALVYFSQQDVDFVILEVGLGGLGDSTNISENPVLSVITSISFDHTDRLGDTIEKIANEKAGIIKKGCPVITNVDETDARKTIARRAYEKSAPLTDASKIIPYSIERSREKYSFNVEIMGKLYFDMEITMPGDHQVRNAVCALTAIEVLRQKKLIQIEKEKLKKGMCRASQPGRFEIIGKFILDGAHNKAGTKALADTMASIYGDKKILTVVGFLKDKEAGSMIRELNRFTDHYIVTEPPSPRKLPAKDLAALIDTGHEVYEDPDEAYKAAVDLGEKYDAVLVAGSFYLISHIRRYLK